MPRKAFFPGESGVYRPQETPDPLTDLREAGINGHPYPALESHPLGLLVRCQGEAAAQEGGYFRQVSFPALEGLEYGLVQRCAVKVETQTKLVYIVKILHPAVCFRKIDTGLKLLGDDRFQGVRLEMRRIHV